MDLKKKYEFALKVAHTETGKLDIYDSFKLPSFMNDKTKYKEIKKDCIFPYELTDKATDNDKEEYVRYVLEYAGFDVDELDNEK